MRLFNFTIPRDILLAEDRPQRSVLGHPSSLRPDGVSGVDLKPNLTIEGTVSRDASARAGKLALYHLHRDRTVDGAAEADGYLQGTLTIKNELDPSGKPIDSGDIPVEGTIRTLFDAISGNTTLPGQVITLYSRED